MQENISSLSNGSTDPIILSSLLPSWYLHWSCLMSKQDLRNHCRVTKFWFGHYVGHLFHIASDLWTKEVTIMLFLRSAVLESRFPTIMACIVSEKEQKAARSCQVRSLWKTSSRDQLSSNHHWGYWSVSPLATRMYMLQATEQTLPRDSVLVQLMREQKEQKKTDCFRAQDPVNPHILRFLLFSFCVPSLPVLFFPTPAWIRFYFKHSHMETPDVLQSAPLYKDLWSSYRKVSLSCYPMFFFVSDFLPDF